MRQFRTVLVLQSLAICSILTMPACFAVAKTDYEKGAAAFQKKDYLAAIDSFENALSKNPKNPNIYYGLASAFSAVGQNFQALHFYQECLRLAPQSPIAANAQKGIDYLQTAGASAAKPAIVPVKPTTRPVQSHPHRQPAFQIASAQTGSAAPFRLANLAPALTPEQSMYLFPPSSQSSARLQAPPLPVPQAGTFGPVQSPYGAQQTQVAFQPPTYSPLGQQGNQPFAMRHGNRGQQFAGMPYGQQMGNQPYGGTNGPFSFTGNQQGGQMFGRMHHSHHMRGQRGYMQSGGGGGYSQSSYSGGYGGYGHTPTLVVREYSFPNSGTASASSASVGKPDDVPQVELLAKQEKLVVDKAPAGSKIVQPH